MLVMSLKFSILEFGTLITIIVQNGACEPKCPKSSQKLNFLDFRAVIKRHVLAKDVVCGTY